MKYLHLLLVLLMISLLSACASQKEKALEMTKHKQDARVLPVTKRMPAKSLAKAANVDGDVIGTPLPGGQFAKLKIGMTLDEVKKLIGSPNKNWKHHGKKESRESAYWDIKYSYAHEGVLTFSHSNEYFLIRILVNRVE